VLPKCYCCRYHVREYGYLCGTVFPLRQFSLPWHPPFILIHKNLFSYKWHLPLAWSADAVNERPWTETLLQIDETNKVSSRALRSALIPASSGPFRSWALEMAACKMQCFVTSSFEVPKDNGYPNNNAQGWRKRYGLPKDRATRDTNELKFSIPFKALAQSPKFKRDSS